MVQTIAVSEAVLNETMFGYLLEDIDALSAEPTNWWHPRVKIIDSWLKDEANRAGIPDDGSEEMIRRHIQRGGIYPNVQLKCWKHILLELQDVPCFATQYADSTRAAAVNVSPSRGKIRPGKELIILSDDAPNQESAVSNDSDELLPSDEFASERGGEQSQRAGAAAGDATASAAISSSSSGGAKKFSSLSMAERQAEWLRKKQEKVDAERSRQEEEKEKELTFQPKILRRSTLGDRPTKDPPPRMLQRSDTSGGGGSARKIDISGEPPKVNAGPKEKAIPRVPPRSAGRRKKQQQVSASQPIEISSNLLESMKSELTASMAKSAALTLALAAVGTTGDSDATDLDDPTQDDSATGNADSTEQEALLDTAPLLPLKPWSAQPMIGGRRVGFDSSETKARLVLQDAAKFELSSMYRKTDKKAQRDGVALHMGRREDTFEEEVIAVLFDREKVSELEAVRWWSDHEHRFAHFIRELPKPIEFGGGE